MSKEHRGTEWKVGLFLTIGLFIIAVMAVKFGKLGQGFDKYYSVTAEFDNASGLLKGASVYLAGSPVGFAAEAPSLVEGRFAVKVPIRIREGVSIPRGSSFFIASSGFIGDAYVSISPPANPNMDDLIQPDEYIKGSRLEGFGDLASKGGETIESLNKRLAQLETTIGKVNDEVLSKKNTDNLAATFENLKTISENLKATTKEIDDFVVKGKDAVASAKDTIDKAKGAVGKLDTTFEKTNAAIAKIDSAVDDAKQFIATTGKTVESIRLLVNKANSGKGALGMLLSDPQTASDLKALINNLKERGILFYKDLEKKKQ